MENKRYDRTYLFYYSPMKLLSAQMNLSHKNFVFISEIVFSLYGYREF